MAIKNSHYNNVSVNDRENKKTCVIVMQMIFYDHSQFSKGYNDFS